MANFSGFSFKIPKQCKLVQNDLNTTWNFTCDERFHGYNANDWIFLCLSVSSTLILFLLSERDTPKKWKFCSRGPGIMYPLNMLDGYQYRLAYAAAFGAMTFELTSILLDPTGTKITFNVNRLVSDIAFVQEYKFVRVLLLLVQVIICTALYYPLFACLSTSYKFVGSLIGLLQSSYRMGSYIWLSTCRDRTYDGIAVNLIVSRYLLAFLLWPNIVMLAALSSQYIYTIVKCVRNRKLLHFPARKKIALPHHEERVQYLLGKKPLPWAEKDLHHVSLLNKEKFIQNFGFRHVPGFRFPTRIIATFVITVIAVYQIGLQVVSGVFELLAWVKKLLECRYYLFPEDLQKYLKPYEVYVERSVFYMDLTAGLWIAVMGLNSLLAIIYIYHSCVVYRRHTQKLYRGDYSMFPRGWSRESIPSQMASASRHAGFQIAYTIWGFVIIQIVVFLIVAVITFVILIPMIDYGYFEILWFVLQLFVFPLILKQLIQLAQKLAARYFFLQPKTNPEDPSVPMAIDNRKAWYNQAFFFFFWNLFLGVISALLRIGKGFLLGVLFIPRIDRPVLMQGFETKDTGFYSYLSVLTVLNAHDHPVVKVFVDVLMRNVKEKRARIAQLETLDPENMKSTKEEIEKKSLRNTYNGSKRAKYYWSLAYTLINNPDLLAYRKYDDEPENEKGELRKQKILLAALKKRNGETTSNMYEHDISSLEEQEPSDGDVLSTYI